MDEIKLCTGYTGPGDKRIDLIPLSLPVLEQCEPIYETLPGWNTSLAGAETYEDLPDAARVYVDRIEDLLDVKIEAVSVGARRGLTILRRASFF